MIGTVALGILVPFIGTSLGAAMVFLLKKEINPKIQKLLLGFASGVMIAASIWSLILPSVELAKEQSNGFPPRSASSRGCLCFCCSIRSSRISISIRRCPKGINRRWENPSCCFYPSLCTMCPRGWLSARYLRGFSPRGRKSRLRRHSLCP